jgi:uncharacterized protein (TIGR02270 family)
MVRATATPFWDLIEESRDEAAFLWKRWEADLSSPVRSLQEVWSWSEDRLQGALDGVRVAGNQLVRICGADLDGADTARLTVVAHLFAAGSVPEARTQLATALRGATGPRLWAMIRGIEAAELDATFAPVTTALSTGRPEHLAALCRLKAFRRSTPGPEAAAAFESGDPLLQVHALRVLRHAKDDSAGQYVTSGLHSDMPEVRRAAMECGLYQRQAGAWDAIRKLVHERDPVSGPFLSLLAALGSPEDRENVVSALRVPALQRSGVFALGHIGTPEAAEICLQAMRDPKLARSAGEAYCAITGADLERDGLTAPEPPAGESLPDFADDALDANLVPRAHESWPLPDESKVRAHWQTANAGYVTGARHIYGKPVDLGVLLTAVETGPMLRRPDLLAELSIRTGGRYDVEPRAFAHVQRRMMSAGRAAMR